MINSENFSSIIFDVFVDIFSCFGIIIDQYILNIVESCMNLFLELSWSIKDNIFGTSLSISRWAWFKISFYFLNLRFDGIEILLSIWLFAVSAWKFAFMTSVQDQEGSMLILNAAVIKTFYLQCVAELFLAIDKNGE